MPWLYSATANAQDADQLEEVVVTAERRSEDIQKTPIAIDVVSASDLANQGITSGDQIAGLVPGVAMFHERGGSSLFVRGIGNSASNPYADPDVTYNLDGVPGTLPSAVNGQYFDLQRLEVLKGPQGTLYGRNATAGAVNVVSQDPQQVYSGSGEITVGDYALFRTNGMLNLPINDQLAVRAAFTSERHSGYLSNGLNDADDYAGRLKALWRPTDKLSVLLGTEYDHQGGKGDQRVPVLSSTGAYYWPAVLGHGNAWTFEDTMASPGGGETQLVPANPHQINNNWRTWAQVNWDLGFGSLVVLPAYQDNKEDWDDADQGFGFAQQMHDIARTLEVRLTSNDAAGQRLKWVAGAFALNENLPSAVQVQQSYPVIGSGTPEQMQDTTTPYDKTESYAGFAQATYTLIDPLRLTGGVRYTKDNKTEAGVTTNDALPGVPNSFNEYWKVREAKVTWRVGFDADVAPMSMLYGNVSSGYKAGGFSAAPTPGLTPGLTIEPSLVPLLTYKPEQLLAYDLGLKNNFLDRRLQVDLEVFYWIYTNQQVQTIFLLPLANLPPVIVPSVVNAGRGVDEGLDLSADYKLTSNDKITGSLEYLNSRYSSFSYPFIFPNNPVNDSGKPFINAPRWSGNLSYEHDWRIAGGGTIEGSVNTHLTTHYWIGYDYTPKAEEQGGYSKTDITLGFTSADEKWYTRAWVKNIENADVRIIGGAAVPGSAAGGLAPTGPGGTSLDWVNVEPPRTYGITLGARF